MLVEKNSDNMIVITLCQEEMNRIYASLYSVRFDMPFRNGGLTKDDIIRFDLMISEGNEFIASPLKTV